MKEFEITLNICGMDMLVKGSVSNSEEIEIDSVEIESVNFNKFIKDLEGDIFDAIQIEEECIKNAIAEDIIDEKKIEQFYGGK